MLVSTRPSRHPQIMAVWGMGIMIGPILGPILGGWLTETANWRWVFFVNLPVGIASLVILLTCLPARPKRERRFDIIGFLLMAIALAAFQLLLDRGMQEDWLASPEIWVYLVLTLSATWMLVIHFATAPSPLFERSLFAERNFAIALSFMVVIGIVMFAVMALLPPMLQNVFGYGMIDTGIVSGLLQSLGMGLVFIPLRVSAFATLSPAMRTDGSSLLNLFRSLGASAGISLMTVLLARNQTSHVDLGAHVTAATGSILDFSTVDRFQTLGDTAMVLLDAEVNRQAAMIAYLDDFWLMMWITLSAAPFAFLMRKNTEPAGPIAPSE